MQITIKKISSEITYKNITTCDTFEVNGKKVFVYTTDIQDNIHNNYESDQDIQGIDNLTNLEYEAFGEELTEHLELEEGQETIINIEE